MVAWVSRSGTNRNDNSAKDARELGHTASLILALTYTSIVDVLKRENYAAAKATNDELVALAHEKGALFWKLGGVLLQGHIIALAGNATEGTQIISSSMTSLRSMGAKMFVPFMLAHLSRAYVEIGQVDAAVRFISDAFTHIETTKESWFEAEVNRVAGLIALNTPEHDASKAQIYFERALLIARQQQAKSLRTPRRHEHGAALARSGKATARSRASRSGLRLVHRRLRHARSEGGKGVTRPIGVIDLFTHHFEPFRHTNQRRRGT